MISSEQQIFDDVEIRVFKTFEKEDEDPGPDPDAPGDAASDEAGDESYVAEIITPGEKASCNLPPLPSEALQKANDVQAYGALLFDWLFREDIKETFMRARWSTENYSRSSGSVSVGGLRLRLWLDPHSPELHRLWWETLYDSVRNEPLSLTLVFSRYVRVKTPVGHLISERPLRMLLLAFNPAGLERLELNDLNMMLERKVVSGATEQLSSLMLLDQLSSTPSVSEVRQRLKDHYHLIHVLAHVIFDASDGTKSSGFLVLADDNLQAIKVPFEEVTELLAPSSEKPPHFVFLGTPMSVDVHSSEHVRETIASLAPMLLKAGVQAVIAIQAPINDTDLLRFAERFYDILIRTGLIDVAACEARTRIYNPDRWEWAHPVLYTRTPDARIFQPLPEGLEILVQKSFSLSS